MASASTPTPPADTGAWDHDVEIAVTVHLAEGHRRVHLPDLHAATRAAKAVVENMLADKGTPYEIQSTEATVRYVYVGSQRTF